METQHVFKPCDTAFTIWGEEVKLEECGYLGNRNHRVQFSAHNKIYVATEDGFNDSETKKFQILYPHPVRVTLVPEFEEGEEIEVSDDENAWDNGYFVHKLSTGQFIVSKTKPVGHSDEPTILSYYFARKITKLEKTRTELMEELIKLLEKKISFYQAVDKGEASLADVGVILTESRDLNLKISSLQEQLKQKS